ncbi:MAG: restriction endonuclease subunit S [Oscillospiraceae bacterium]|nr:restriction endonuclease subunit S [Oscillospiraceae bacterium]
MNYKETPFGKIPNSWVLSPISDVTNLVTDYVANGSFAALAENVKYKDTEDIAVLIRLVDYNNGFKGDFVFIDEHAYSFLSKSKLYGGEIIISNVGANVGTVFRCPFLPYKMSLAPNSIMVKFKGNDSFYYYWLKSKAGQHMLHSIVTGSAQPKFNKTNFRDMLVPVPPKKTQDEIVSILQPIDEKIELSNRINENLEQQAFALFDSYFPAVSAGENTIGDYITPKRGKNLLSKDAIFGDVPVVAGGLEPSTYHNTANTSSPVLTISASGANAGFIRLWHVPVWSSDSSFIDATMTPYVYFWYVMLKKRQKEIFDSQTGSAQPHIYPQHIAVMPVAELNEDDVNGFTEQVTPLFCMIDANVEENKRLASMRDALLPRLMSGELDVPDVDP